jgi:hypothetical protein
LSGVIAIAAGGFHNLALKEDGTVIAWGAGTNVSGVNNYGQSVIPSNLSNVVAIAAGLYHSMALKADGQVAVWGQNSFGQTNLPAALSNVVAIAAGDYHSMALRRDGTLALWGASSFFNDGQATLPAGVSNYVAIAGGGSDSGAIVNNGASFFCTQPLNRTIYSGGSAIFDAEAVSPFPVTYQWTFNNDDIAGATSNRVVLTNAPLTAAGIYECVGSNAMGVATSRVANLVVLRSVPRFDTMGGMSFSASGFDFQITGLSGHGSVVVYASTNLNDWWPMATNPPVVGRLRILDANATNGSRFYRVLEQ